MGITGVITVISCPHASLRGFEWLGITECDPPAFRYRGLPANGSLILSYKTVEVACEKCDLGQMRLDFPVKTYTL